MSLNYLYIIKNMWIISSGSYNPRGHIRTLDATEQDALNARGETADIIWTPGEPRSAILIFLQFWFQPVQTECCLGKGLVLLLNFF